MILIAAALLTAAAAGTLIFSGVLRDSRYRKAEALTEAGDTAGAYRIFSGLGSYRDSEDRCRSLAEDEPYLPYADAEKGDIISFGAWEQDAPPVSRAEELLRCTGILPLKDALPTELSGGELRRMAVARALIMQPDVILADEPTAGLDSENIAAVMKLLRKAADGGAAVLVVSHEDEAADFSDRVLTMDGGSISGS